MTRRAAGPAGSSPPAVAGDHLDLAVVGLQLAVELDRHRRAGERHAASHDRADQPAERPELLARDAAEVLEVRRGVGLDPVVAVAEALEAEELDLERVGLHVGEVDLDLVELVQLLEGVLVGVGEVDLEPAALDLEPVPMPGEQPDRGHGAQVDVSASAVLLEPLLDPALEVGRQQEVGPDGEENHEPRDDSGQKSNP